MGKKVLIIDDDPGMLDMIGFALKNAGFVVHTYHTGVGAWDKILKVIPDVLVLDVMLPGVDGYTLGLQISKDPLTEKLPIVVVTAMEGVKSKFLQLPQVVGFLSKPFDITEMTSIVASAAGGK